MPKLTIPERTYGKAIGCLIDLYKKEPGFIEELQKIRSVYEPAVIKWLDSSVPQWRRLQVELMQAKDRQDDSTTLSDVNIELSKKLSYSVRRFYGGWNVTSELIDYEKELHDLAYRWHLKAKWSGVVLILSHINDVVGIMSEGDETTIEMPVEVIEPMLDKPPLPPLIFKVTAYELMYSTHASWWFEHYVHGKPYEEIAAEHSVEVTENSVRQAVFRFRKLLGIEIG